MAEERKPVVGDLVIFHDLHGKAFNALVTAAWSDTCINIVIVSGDEKKQDQYGRQLERVTSLIKKHENSAHGFYWRWSDEEPAPYKAPQSV